MNQPPFLGCLEASISSHSCSSKMRGNSHPKYKVFHHELLPKLTLWGMPLQVRRQTYKPRKLSFCRGRHWCRVCSKGIPPNEVFPVNLVSGRRSEIWKCRTENHLMCLPGLTWIYDDLCPSCVKKRHRACDQPSHTEMRSNPVSTQARDAPCEGIYHLGARAFLFLCLSPDSS